MVPVESSVEESSNLSEPPDPDIAEIDPTCRYIRYKDVLGKGASKTVYKAFDEVDGIEVAWNQVRIDEVLQSPQDLERLYSEVHLLKSLKHGNIIKFYNSWIDDKKKTINIITELFTSGSLRQYRKKHKKVDIKAVKGWAKQILTGLNYLHSHNPPIIHRDLKCDNIFINGNHGEVKIGDLGLATIMQQANAHSVIGTPEFMAPELYDEDYNELADIYSFGLCLLEMVTFEYPYSECRNSAQIYKKVSSGIKPASLSKVKNPEMKLFIEKCLVPAAQRMSAKDLLKDPFLQVDGSAGHSMDLPGIVTPKVGAFGNRLVLSEEPNSTRKVPSVDVDAENGGKPLVVTFVPNPAGGSYMQCLEIQRVKRNSYFKLKAEMIDANTVSYVLRDEETDPIRNIHFLVFPATDTSVSVAAEMIDSLGVAPQDFMFMAELIDLSLINLIPTWRTSVPINHLMSSNEIPTSRAPANNSPMTEERECSSDVSFHNLFESIHISDGPPSLDASSAEGSHQPTCEVSDYTKLDEVMSHNTVMSEDPASDISFISAVSADGNYKKCSINTGLSVDSGYMDYNGCHMKTEIGEALYGVEMDACFDHRDMVTNGSSDASVFLNSPSNVCSLHPERTDDDELRIELEHIELQYQQAMKELSMKRHEAIMEAKKRLSQRR